MDRSIYRFLCLPIFDEGFRSVLVELNLDKIEMWLALSDSSHGTADHKLSEILPALTKKQEVADKILQRLDMVNILASMISRSTEKDSARDRNRSWLWFSRTASCRCEA